MKNFICGMIFSIPAPIKCNWLAFTATKGAILHYKNSISYSNEQRELYIRTVIKVLDMIFTPHPPLCGPPSPEGELLQSNKRGRPGVQGEAFGNHNSQIYKPSP